MWFVARHASEVPQVGVASLCQSDEKDYEEEETYGAP